MATKQVYPITVHICTPYAVSEKKSSAQKSTPQKSSRPIAR